MAQDVAFGAGIEAIPDDMAGQADAVGRGASASGFERDHVLLGGSGGRFVDISGVSGADSVSDGRSAVVADFDDDGDPDILLVARNSGLRRWNARDQLLFHNQAGQDAGWVRIALEGRRSGRDAIGALVQVRTSAGTVTRAVAAGGFLGSQGDARLLFGLGQDAETGPVTIRWPSGLVQRLAGVPARSSWRVVEGQAPVRVVEQATRLPLPAPAPATDLERLGLVAGRPLPELPVWTTDGARGLLSERIGGKGAVVVLWATWCGACEGALPDIGRLGAPVVAVAVDPPGTEGLAAAAKAHGIGGPALRSEPEALERFLAGRAPALPAAIVVGPDGRVRDATVGWSEDAQRRLGAAAGGL